MECEASGVQQEQNHVGQVENQQQASQRPDVGTQQKQDQQTPQKDEVSEDDVLKSIPDLPTGSF